MEGDSCLKGRGFEYHLNILDGQFLRMFVVKIVMFVWKDENKWKSGREGPLKNLITNLLSFEIDRFVVCNF